MSSTFVRHTPFSTENEKILLRCTFSMEKKLVRFPQYQPLHRFRQFLFHVKAYDLWICHQWSPANQHPPFLRKIEKILLHCTFSMEEELLRFLQPQPLHLFRQFLFHVKAYDLWICHQWLPVNQHPPFWRKTEKILLHCTFSMEEKLLRFPQPRPMDRVRQLLFNMTV
ncbi:hypothetical protein AVEN_9109-1 [Araneus ventricosus]|uniref:Uncharacterized protein n=1 Tax=Araneus ventricosus TaxID=182803 RepID=A0A4Y2PA75_ARAVE|nr:hypothetical protein AVEN_9109-1 [Araneus ventricosus]